MFFVTVKTNVGYTPIADFVVQSETSNQIEETYIKSHNYDYAPWKQNHNGAFTSQARGECPYPFRLANRLILP